MLNMARKKLQPADKTDTFAISVSLPVLEHYRKLPKDIRKAIQTELREPVEQAIKLHVGKHLIAMGELQRIS